MAHPQLLANLLGRALPPAAVEECPADIAPMPSAVEASDRQQPAQALCWAGVCSVLGACGVVCFWSTEGKR